MDQYRTALITGASSGIGECFASALAAQGLDLILVARSRDKLHATAQALTKDHGVKVAVIAADLAQPGSGAALAAEVAKKHLTVDLLINNAGFGGAGIFHKNEAARDQQMIALNIAAVVDLAHAFLPAMVERGRGGILNVASLAGFQPTPYMTVYGATKAFVLSFSEGLWAEYRDKGIQVMALCPGPVDTPFFEATGSGAKLRSTVPRGTMLTAEQVVKEALAGFRRGKSFVVPGMAMKLVSWLPRLVPRSVVAAGAARTMKR
ncbi:MAG TPA: SDR family oxidoreductase [Nevskiaceae bacterium]|nr:SDR family oxidoreductase [Nevskiaceae bacterium]